MSFMSAPNNAKVLNTRPLPMAEALQQALLDANIETLVAPQIGTEILKEDSIASLSSLLSDKTTAWIFVSRTAVNAFIKQWPQSSSFKPQGPIVAVGNGTREQLADTTQLQTDVINIPDKPNSESLLTMPVLNNINRVILIKGIGGRELIETSLLERGIDVVGIDTYKRVVNQYTSLQSKPWQDCNIVLATSVDIASAIFENCAKWPVNLQNQWLKQVNWLVLS
jgi:uroporphyrinogen-III synthase